MTVTTRSADVSTASSPIEDIKKKIEGKKKEKAEMVEKVKCKCITKAGKPCKNYAKEDGKCMIHVKWGGLTAEEYASKTVNPKTKKSKCKCMTKAGSPCQNSAAKDSDMCNVHIRYHAKMTEVAEVEAKVEVKEVDNPEEDESEDEVALNEIEDEVALNEITV